MKSMIKPIALALTLGLVAVPAMAQSRTDTNTKQPPTGPGQSEYAPGKQPGPSKQSAPGQKMKNKNDPASPGASEYAPGQQPKTVPAPKTGATKK